ncbi:putative sugar O-methyltransferase [Methylobacterium radiotolerans]|uniref:putative sugar O-methyltransferase n=1 Tax=Methylobacterium radiotolerans TaxID=31998 RepID=UPI0010579350|nr:MULTISPECIES: putative sugar O-methyltransferase [Methylobacterium]MDE3749209.1 putative sugar O-methyltransferase [Methylobacterium radiotolerans]
MKREIHAGLSGSDPAVWAQILRRPDQNAHFWGFDTVCKAPEGEVEPHELVFRNLNAEGDWRQSYALWLHGALISLAEAVGVMRVFYPETAPGVHYAVHGESADPDPVLDSIAAAIGAEIDFPNPYPGEIGFGTRRGVVGFRALQAIYQAWRIAQIVKDRPQARILEIGAGLGRTAYYAHRFFGTTDYTIVDIPLTNAAQGYFLGRTLGPDAVALLDEQEDRSKIKIIPPEKLPSLVGDYDLILNVDSFTELDRPTTRFYWGFARDRAKYLLSINHEFNPAPLQELLREDTGVSYSRHPYWMRRGYVEELIAFS